MRHLALTTALLAVLACASNNPKARLLEPEVDIVQLSGPAEQNYPAGQMEVQYGVRIANRSSEALTLRRILVEPMGAGGPYRLRRETYHFNKIVPPNGFEDVTFWARAFAQGDAFAIDAQAPVTIRGTAFFDSPSGGVRKVFVKMLNQAGTASQPR
jgi:hypothetical protein